MSSLRIWTLSGIAGAAVLLAACGGSGTSTAPKAAAPTEAKPAGQATTAPAATTAAAPKTEAKAATTPATAAKAGTTGKATGEPVKYGMMCDRSGPVNTIGIKLCDGFINWVEVVNNSLGGVKGRPVQVIEIDNKYEVPIAVDGYKKLTTRDNVAAMQLFGTPIADALTASLNQDKVVGWTPGFGLSPSADGTKFPYIFVGVATYRSQSMAVMDYIVQEWKSKGKTGNPRVIFLKYDNAAGEDAKATIEAEGKNVGIDLIETIPVPVTTIDMTTIMTTVKERNPDYIMALVAGRAPSLMLTAAEKLAMSPENIISFPWSISEDEIEIAKQAAEKYRGIQFTNIEGSNPEAYQILKKYWQDSGQQPNPKSNSVYYARGLMSADLQMEALRLADDPTKGESIKKGAESIKNFTARGMLGTTTITPEDHGGTRQVQMYQVQNGKLVQIKDWFEGPMPKGG